jgi:hypothetical protein
MGAAVSLDIRLDRQRYTPGDIVLGSVLVADGLGAATLEVSLNFHERATQYETVVDTVPGEAAEDEGLDAGAERSFAIELPEDALPNHTSEHGALWWSADASVKTPGRDLLVTRRLEVVLEVRAGDESRVGTMA